MRATFKGILLALAGVVLVVVATEASACSYACVATGGSPFCRRCVDTGACTGATLLQQRTVRLFLHAEHL